MSIDLDMTRTAVARQPAPVVEPLGIGIQYNPEILDWFPFDECDVDAFEVLLDSIMGALDGPYLMLPGFAERMQDLARKCPLVAHSNYGCDFGFGPLEETPAVRRHVPLAKKLNSPWVANHMFYGDDSWLDIWSSPVQFSHAEIDRLADRARRLQEYYGMPLAHENAAYYLPCPGGEMEEAEFLARLVEKSGTYLHVDLHNIYANSINLDGFSARNYLNTIPLDRIVSIHVAGGSWHEGVYHDWHDSPVPDEVWQMLEYVLARSRPGGVFLEYQGQAHHPDTRIMGEEGDKDFIMRDLEIAMSIWDKAYGPESRFSTRKQVLETVA
ncbi:MAG: DUF692 family protein [Rhodobacter sp.]|nr:DUF692 family protein [Rhodobacter sp.]